MGLMIARFEILEEKNPRRISPARAKLPNSLCCYFLQQQQSALEHSLPLESVSFGGVCATAVPTRARMLRINRRCFINSSFDFRMEFGHTIFSRAEPSR